MTRFVPPPAAVLLGVVMLRSKRFPRGAAVLIIIGILFALAPIDGSVPYIVNAGAVLWPAGLFWTGLAMFRTKFANFNG